MKANQIMKTAHETIENWIATIADLQQLLDIIWIELLHLRNCSFEERSTRWANKTNKEILNFRQELSKLKDASMKNQTI